MPLLRGVALVNGVAGTHPERRIEAAAHVPYPLALDVGVGQAWLSEQPWLIGEIEQSYDFASGEVTSRFFVGFENNRLQFEVLTFASRSHPSLVLQRTKISAERSGRLRLCVSIDTAGVRGHGERHRTATPGEPQPACDGSIRWVTEGNLSTCGLAYTADCAGAVGREANRQFDWRGPLSTHLEVDATPGKPVVIDQIAAMIPSIVHERPDEEAVRRVAEGQRLGLDELRLRNKAIWNDLWRGRIIIDGASEAHQRIVDAAFFYLNSSVHKASPAATSIFGLATWTNYHYYYGHVMWDIDAFCVPPLSFFQPDAARSLLDFRRRGLEAAKSYARLFGRDGLQFPWEAAPLSGQEATPGAGSGASHADHVSLHVARAFSFYSDVDGDDRYLAEITWPILAGVADWFCSRVTWTARGAELLGATGPAEVADPPPNDAFTLMAGHEVLTRAIRTANQLNHAVPEIWLETRNNLYLPRRDDGVIPSHDGFRINEEKGATPSPLAGFFPYNYPATEHERAATLAFYLERWADYVGSPMLPALYPVWASMAGDRALALKLFDEGYAKYDSQRFHQCLEYRKDHPDSAVPAGPFFANLAGMLSGLLLGLTGIVTDETDPMNWPRRAITLPEGWKAIRVERLWVRGQPMSLLAEHGARRAILMPCSPTALSRN